MEYLLIYFFQKSGHSGFGSCKGMFEQYPPSMDGVRRLQDMIKEEFSYDSVLLLNWLPLSEEEPSGNQDA